jgi:hypothetical protein
MEVKKSGPQATFVTGRGDSISHLVQLACSDHYDELLSGDHRRGYDTPGQLRTVVVAVVRSRRSTR